MEEAEIKGTVDNKTVINRRFVGWLMLNINNGSMIVRKTKPAKLTSSFVLPVKLDITVTGPTTPEVIAKGNVVLPFSKVKEIFLELL